MGVNKFQVDEEQQFDYLRVNPESEREQVKRLEDLRKTRNNEKVKATLQDLRIGAEGDSNLVPLILEAVRVYATLGEICGVLRDVFGEYKAADL